MSKYLKQKKYIPLGYSKLYEEVQIKIYATLSHTDDNHKTLYFGIFYNFEDLSQVVIDM